MAWMFPGTKLYTDYGLPTVIKDGYEGNPTVFGAVNKIITKIIDVPIVPMVGENISKVDPLRDLFKDSNLDYSFEEFRAHRHLFRLLLGEAITYAPSYVAGNNKGEPMSLEVMPAHEVLIETGGPDDPIRYYKLQNNERVEFFPEDIYHSRLFLNVDFSNGKQYRGISPLKVAINVINSMNAGDKLTADSYATGMPPGILYNKNLESADVEKQRRKMEIEWRKKEKDVPVFGAGELGWLPLGFSNLKDLQVIQNDARGLRILCNLWGIHESLFSGDASTLDNLKVARRLMYEDRIMPDINEELAFYNSLFASTGITYVADYSQVPALQDDRLSIAQIYAIGIDKKAVTRNEMREALGLAEINEPLMGEEGLIESILFTPDVQGIDTGGDDDDPEDNEGKSKKRNKRIG